ncbi:MAG: hypothetical protein IKQ31_03910 [Clostridia bacterium]|nr:hypothetical protein [Clostridia bacterium]
MDKNGIQQIKDDPAVRKEVLKLILGHTLVNVGAGDQNPVASGSFPKVTTPIYFNKKCKSEMDFIISTLNDSKNSGRVMECGFIFLGSHNSDANNIHMDKVFVDNLDYSIKKNSNDVNNKHFLTNLKFISELPKVLYYFNELTVEQISSSLEKERQTNYAIICDVIKSTIGKEEFDHLHAEVKKGMISQCIDIANYVSECKSRKQQPVCLIGHTHPDLTPILGGNNPLRTDATPSLADVQGAYDLALEYYPRDDRPRNWPPVYFGDIIINQNNKGQPVYNVFSIIDPRTMDGICGYSNVYAPNGAMALTMYDRLAETTIDGIKNSMRIEEKTQNREYKK